MYWRNFMYDEVRMICTLGCTQMWKSPADWRSSSPGTSGRPEYATMLRLLYIASHGPLVRSKIQFCGLAGSMCFRWIVIAW
jgi:hypothetical protein